MSIREHSVTIIQQSIALLALLDYVENAAARPTFLESVFYQKALEALKHTSTPKNGLHAECSGATGDNGRCSCSHSRLFYLRACFLEFECGTVLGVFCAAAG